MARRLRHSPDLAVAAAAADAQQRRAALTQAVSRVAGQLGVRQDTIMVGLGSLTGPVGGATSRHGLTELPTVLTATYLDDPGTVLAARWRAPTRAAADLAGRPGDHCTAATVAGRPR